jgi:hypothetical protein
MEKGKFYTEEELVEKVQKGEFGWLDYVNHYSREWKQEYQMYCKSRGVPICNETAEAYIELKQQQLEEALENGDA